MTRPAPVRPAGFWLDALLLAGFVALTGLLNAGHLLDVDLAVRNWCHAHQPVVAYRLARGGNLLGQGTPLTVVAGLIALYRAWRARSVRMLLPVVAAFALTFGLISPLKWATNRAAPDTWTIPHPELFGGGGRSYPSGHLANAIVWYGVIALVLQPWLSPLWNRVIRIVPPVVLSITTVYLVYHWASDTVAGIILGLLLDRLVHRVPWDTIRLPRRLTPGEPSSLPPAGAHNP